MWICTRQVGRSLLSFSPLPVGFGGGIGVWDHGWPKMLNLVRTKVSVLLRRISVTAKELVSFVLGFGILNACPPFHAVVVKLKSMFDSKIPLNAIFIQIMQTSVEDFIMKLKNFAAGKSKKLTVKSGESESLVFCVAVRCPSSFLTAARRPRSPLLHPPRR